MLLEQLWEGMAIFATMLLDSYLNPIGAYVGIFIALPFAVLFLTITSLIGMVLLLSFLGISVIGGGVAVVMVFAVLAAVFYAIIGFGYGLTRACRLLAMRTKPSRLILLGSRSERELKASSIGDKAAYLNQLIAWNEHVPFGMVIPVRAFRQMLRKNRIQLVGDDGHDWGIVDRIMGAELPRPLLRELASHADRFGDGPVVVRSSFEGEDGKEASFPGIYHSVRDVDPSDIAALADAVKTVYASFWHDRAVSYRRKKGRIQHPRPGVIIQRQIPHAIWGFAASINIANGYADERTIEIRYGDQSAAIVYNALNKSWRIYGAFPDWLMADPGQFFTELDSLLRRLAARLGRPVEIEWGLYAGDIYLYQVRPIPSPPQVRTLTNSFIVETIAYPLTPLSYDVIYGDGAGGDKSEEIIVSAFKELGIETRKPFMVRIGSMHYVDHTVFNELAGRFSMNGLPLRKLPALLFWLLRCIFSAGKLINDELPAIRREMESLKRKAPSFNGRAAVAEMNSVAFKTLRTLVVAQNRIGLCCNIVIEWDRQLLISAEATGAGQMAESFMTAGKNRFMECMELIAAQSAASNGRKLIELAAETIGVYAEREAELSAKRYHEDEDTLREIVRRAQAFDSAFKQAAAGAPGFPARRHSIAWEPWLDRAFRAAANRLIDARESISFTISHCNAAMRALALSVGAELENRSLLADAGDVFYLTTGELCGLFDKNPPFLVKRIVEERSSIYRAEVAKPPGPIIHQDSEGYLINESEPGSGSFQGLGVVPGRVSGRALVAPSPAESFNLWEDVELILLIPDAAASWISVLPKVKGVVIESGGALAHLVMVCREYGLPCITGAAGVCGRFENGALLTIDGGTGRIEPC